MASSEDTEITLGTGKLLVLFFGLVAICALFFAFGYSLGRKSEPILAATSAAQPAASPAKTSSTTTPTPTMTFYKNVEQKDANAELTPATDTKTDAPAAPTDAAAATQPATSASQTPGANSQGPSTILPTSAYFVQVAAVTKQEDADALVDALKKKDYPAFVAPQTKIDTFFHVQVGPYSDVKDAEAMRTRLIADGYSPIVKK
jgi:DedD protein